VYHRIGSVHAVIWQAGTNWAGPVRIKIYYGPEWWTYVPPLSAHNVFFEEGRCSKNINTQYFSEKGSDFTKYLFTRGQSFYYYYYFTQIDIALWHFISLTSLRIWSAWLSYILGYGIWSAWLSYILGYGIWSAWLSYILGCIWSAWLSYILGYGIWSAWLSYILGYGILFSWLLHILEYAILSSWLL